jgi:high-affinity iron transporter
VLPTFVIGLREGLEASLIVGIIATFLGQQGRRDAMRWMWTGVAAAITLCGAVAIVLRVTEENLPQRQQEGLETIVSLAAVAMVTWMIVWMRRHARGLKHDLEGKAAAALAGGSVGTLVLMAFFAVLREGFETAVFLLAAFQGARDPGAAGAGALLGIIVSVAIGIAVYRGGVRLNLERFFRFTGFVLVLVAAGLVATAAHTAHEAGWLNVGQHQVLDLSWLVGPGSVRSALLTGMLGVQVRPVVVEVLGWLVYALPMSLFVLWPARPRRSGGVGGSSGGERVAERRSVGARTAVTVTALVAVLALAGCGSSPSADGEGSNVPTVDIELAKTGCSPAKLSLPAGRTKFAVSNTDADSVTEFEIEDGGRIIAEAENIPPGLSKSFSVTLKPGKFKLLCPGGTENKGQGTLEVTR